MNSLNVNRVSKRLRELLESHIDLKDVGDRENHFETRALAGIALMIKSRLTVEETASCITDGYHDLGIDAIYLDESQKTLFLVQSKWRNDGSGSINQNEMNSFASGIKRILNFEIEGANERIQSKKYDIERALDGIDYKIESIFIHTGNSDTNGFIMKPMMELMEQTNDEAGEILCFSQIAFREIYAYLSGMDVSDDVTLDDVVLKNWGSISDPFLVYYGVIPAVAVGEWYKKYGNKLFALNLRYYKGRTDVNDGIKRSLSNEPEMFFYYNNGIKLLCKRIIRKAKNSTTNETGIFTLEGVSLINGAQTAGSIGAVYLNDPTKLDKAFVSVQMIDMSNMSESIEQQIAKLSNTQNRIESKDFASQDPNQERIKRELLFSHYNYLYKGGDEITDASHQFSYEEAIVSLACLYDDVSLAATAKRNIGALSEDISKAPYKLLFNNKTNSYELLNSVLSVREVERTLQMKKQSATGKLYGVCVHGNRLIEHIVLHRLKKKEDFSNSVIDIGKYSLTINTDIDTIIPVIVRELETTYADSYPANVFKNQTKCKAISELLNDLNV